MVNGFLLSLFATTVFGHVKGSDYESILLRAAYDLSSFDSLFSSVIPKLSLFVISLLILSSVAEFVNTFNNPLTVDFTLLIVFDANFPTRFLFEELSSCDLS